MVIENIIALNISSKLFFLSVFLSSSYNRVQLCDTNVFIDVDFSPSLY